MRDHAAIARVSAARLVLLALIAAAAVVTACGGDDGDTSPAPTPGGATIAGRTAPASPEMDPTEAASVEPAATEADAVATTPAATVRAASPTVGPASAAPALCDLAIADTPPGPVASPELAEISGLAASRMQAVIWAHNDSGDSARVFAIGTDGAALATYALNGVDAVDWEDMAIGPGPEAGAPYLYLGDIGDNAAARPEIMVNRVREPRVEPSALAFTVEAEAIALTYPDGAHDAETLLVDPVTGDLFIVTKDVTGGPSGLYRAPAAALSAPPVALERVATVNFATLEPRREIPAGSPPLPTALPRVPTGGDISPDGSLIAIRTYGTVWIWRRAAGASIAEAFAELPCEGPSAIEAQGEAIAFEADGGGYVTAGEGANPPLHRYRP
jgi:hypothetical protein